MHEMTAQAGAGSARRCRMPILVISQPRILSREGSRGTGQIESEWVRVVGTAGGSPAGTRTANEEETDDRDGRRSLIERPRG